MTTVVGFEAPTATLDQVKSKLQAVVERISDHAHVVWRDERQPFVADGVIVKLHLRTIQGVGTPELRTRFVAGDAGDPDVPTVGTEIKNDICEQKTMTLSVLVECFDQVVTAHSLLEKMRTRFWRPWTLRALETVDVAVLKADATQELPTTYDRRVWSAAAFDLHLGWVNVDTQEDFDQSAQADDETDGDTFIETLVVNQGLPTEQRITLP